MESHLYTCQYCYKEYEPTRRRVQKYCSTACRVSAHKLRKQITEVNEEEVQLPTIQNNDVVEPVATEFYDPVQKVDKMSEAGVGNAMVGNLLADALKSIGKSILPDENKPATKREVNELKSLIKGDRYLPIRNLPPNQYGQYAYFDIERWELVYFSPQQ